MDSPQDNEIYEECSQGIVVNILTGEILCYPCSPNLRDYKLYSGKIPGNFKVYDSVDGLYVTLYYFENAWHVASKWDANGSIPMCWKENSLRISLSKLFWEIWGNQVLPTNREMCYTFVMATNRQRIIVNYPQEKLLLVNVTDLKTMKSVDNFSSSYETLKMYNFSSIEEILQESFKLNPFVQKGFIIVSQYFPIIEIKSPQYVAVHSSILYANPGFGPMNLNADNIEDAAMLELIRMGEAEVFLAYFPRWETMYRKVKQRFDEYVHQIESLFDELKKIDDQKEFAVKAKSSAFSTLLFEMRKNTALTVRELLSYSRNKTVMKELESAVLQ